MATTRQRVDKDTFKQIFRDHWGPFQQGHPRYQDRHVQGVIDKMLGCGTPELGYTTYLCPHCLERIFPPIQSARSPLSSCIH